MEIAFTDTPLDFYNFYVLGLPPANFNTTFAQYNLQYGNVTYDYDNSSTPALTSWNNISDAYPTDTMTYQTGLNVDPNAVITSYFLSDISTAVLSIPSFYENGDGIGTFSEAILDFVNNATHNNASKVIIDLQQNSGGQESLVYDAFLRVSIETGKAIVHD